ncbi:hypothetical protein Lal_00042526 [Lupinus albus]|nr:hypothetical protein Lal_00042526 [Lupinus albus]
MPQREEFLAKRLEGAPIPEHRNNIKCKLCGKVIKWGITRLKQHISHYRGQVVGCPRVTSVVRESMMKLLLDGEEKKIDSKKRKDEFKARLRGDTNEEDIDDYIDEQVRQAKQASLNSQYEWEQMQHFRQKKGGGSSCASAIDASRPQYIDFNLRSTYVYLVRSKSAKQPKITGLFMDAARKKLREVVGKFIIYERVSMNVTRSHWFHNLIVAATEASQGVKCPTPYEILTVCLKAEYNNTCEWIKTLKCTWKETGVTIMCDSLTDSINHKHIMNFLVYSNKGTIFTNSVDAFDVDSRNTDYYFHLLN